MTRAPFIVFEGIDGSGTVSRLAVRLTATPTGRALTFRRAIGRQRRVWAA